MRFRQGFRRCAWHAHDHGHDHGHGHGRGGFRRGRFFDQGDLRLVILGLLAQQPRHGYEIIKAIEARLGGAYVPSPGVVYPTLTYLEELGYAEVGEAAGGKKLYAVTAEGLAFLEQNRGQVDALFARMDQAAPDADFAPRLTRAMGNLKLALKLKLAAGGLTAEQMDKIAAALDSAALEIERS